MKKITVNFTSVEVGQILSGINMTDAQHNILVEMFTQSQNFASAFIKATLGIEVCAINLLIGRTGKFNVKRAYSKKEGMWVDCNEIVDSKVISADIISGMITIERQSVSIDDKGDLHVSPKKIEHQSILPDEIDLDQLYPVEA